MRHGAEEVTMYARGRRIAASSEEVEYAQLDGAQLVFGHTVESITPEGPVFRISVFDEDNKVVGYEDERVQIYADATIIAASQGPKNKLLLTTDGLEGSDQGLLVVDEHMMTTVPGVFAAGDVVHGSRTVVDAVREARIAAKGIMEYVESGR
jgi:glutamate synthase (NADPH/NADH) small chain